MHLTTPLETVLKRDRAIVLAGLLGIAALAWAYTVYQAQSMTGMDMGAGGMAMAQVRPWGAGDFVLMYIMWAVMMVAMMVPSAAPMILVFANVNRQRRMQQRPFVPTGLFLASYVLVWGGFAAAAVIAQWGLHLATLLSPMVATTSPIIGGALLLAAGVFQWTPIKNACLTRCRTPLGFIMAEWREGTGGAFKMGLRHGMYCLGCCWVLMALLFVLGVMNLLWIAALAGFVLLEKVAPAGPWVGRVAGLLLVGWGVWMIAGTLV